MRRARTLFLSLLFLACSSLLEDRLLVTPPAAVFLRVDPTPAVGARWATRVTLVLVFTAPTLQVLVSALVSSIDEDGTDRPGCGRGLSLSTIMGSALTTGNGNGNGNGSGSLFQGGCNSPKLSGCSFIRNPAIPESSIRSNAKSSR